MSKVTRLAALGAGASFAAALATQPALQTFLARWSGYNAPGGVWRIIAIFFLLTNMKNLPFVWHLRFFRAFFYQLHFQPTPIPPHALFQPMISSTRAPVLETDYNLHKSNSTYFSDMDISRTQLFTALMRNALKEKMRLGKKATELEGMGASQGTSGKHMIALGGISCFFKREILPYHKYEMWTRLLTWDKKWFYLVTYLVKPGVGRPSGWTLQPWRKGRNEEVDPEKLKGAVFATALAKYVIKRGRITIPPEQALITAKMVPHKPEGWVFNGEVGTNGTANGTANGHADAVLPEKTGEEWNWDVIEAERLRGQRFAESFATLDDLHDMFDGGKNGALGEYPDFLFR